MTIKNVNDLRNSIKNSIYKHRRSRKQNIYLGIFYIIIIEKIMKQLSVLFIFLEFPKSNVKVSTYIVDFLATLRF